jgi:CNT family concentrative nucleoside transporter
MQAVLGIVVLLAIAWALSEARRDVRVLPVLAGLAVQFTIAFVLLRFPLARDLLLALNGVVHAIERATTAGTSFVFGALGGGEPPADLAALGQMYVFAFRVLPQIVVFSVLVAVLWYWRVLPFLIHVFAWALRRTLGVGGAVGVAAASSVFLGPVEISLVVRAYLASVSRSEFFVILTCGMATVAGSIMVLYANVLGPVIDGALGHILVASVVNVVGAVTIARIMIPSDVTTEGGDVAAALSYGSTMDAVTRGTADGLRLAVNVGAMLIALVSLVALVNAVLSLLPAAIPLTLERIMGWAFAPVAWLIGIPWAEAPLAGSLLGTKIVLNELVAYIQLAGVAPEHLSAASRLILTYALCGFANFGSLGIMLGGLAALVPERRDELLRLAPRTLVSGTLVTCVTGAIAGLVSAL